jgi:hypothetical protein
LLLSLLISAARLEERDEAYGSKVSFESGRKHVGEKLECYREQELHEGNKDERKEGDQTQ